MTEIERMKRDGIRKLLVDDDSNQYYTEISKIYDVKRPCLYDWQKNLIKDINWLPNHEKKSETARVFTDSQF